MTRAFLPRSVEKAVLRLFEDLATPVSLKLKMLYDAGEWDQIASQRIDPSHYLCAESYWRDASAVSILKKLKELPTSFDRKAAAERVFLESELACARTNIRLLPYLSPGFPDSDVGVLSYVKRVQKIASGILGGCPDNVPGRFGPGATFGDRGRLTTVPDKMSSEPTLTAGAAFYLFPWVGTLWAKAIGTSAKNLSFVQGNRFTTVPKDGEKDRGIAVEPSINLFYQLGYGRVIRQRLRNRGINLTDGQDIHRRVACEASIEGHLCTMDLSNASDTISHNLVKLCLATSGRWLEVLTDLRSPKTLFKEKWRLLEKFSSMGNGFTFELETLIFLCLILALDPTGQKLVPGSNVFVYGDDIILPVEYSNALISALSFFGMTVNKRKTFLDGPFRESCGGDFFLGVDVRPYFLKDTPCEPQQLFSLANGLRRCSDARFAFTRRSWFAVLDGIPSQLRDCRGPQGLGDLVLLDDERSWRPRWRSGIRYFRCYRPAKYRKVSWNRFSPEVTLAGACYGVPYGNGGIIPRNAVCGYKIGWVAYS